eukprot:Hpha_TRINITY_DN8092_c0_g1::TRINITY_DN8092_c0_g1_i1::g.140034::m.140034
MSKWWEAPPPPPVIQNPTFPQSFAPPHEEPWASAPVSATKIPSEREEVAGRVAALEQALRRERERSAELEQLLKHTPPVSAEERARQRVADIEHRIRAVASVGASPEARELLTANFNARVLPSLSPESPESHPTPRRTGDGVGGVVPHHPHQQPHPHPHHPHHHDPSPLGYSPASLSPLSPLQAPDLCPPSVHPAPVLSGDNALYRPPAGRPPPHRRQYPSPPRERGVQQQPPPVAPPPQTLVQQPPQQYRAPPAPAPSPSVMLSTPQQRVSVQYNSGPGPVPRRTTWRGSPTRQEGTYIGDRGALSRALRKHDQRVAPSTNFCDIRHLIKRGDAVHATTSVWADGLRVSQHMADGSNRARPRQRTAWCGRLKRDVGWGDLSSVDRQRREELMLSRQSRGASPSAGFQRSHSREGRARYGGGSGALRSTSAPIPSRRLQRPDLSNVV